MDFSNVEEIYPLSPIQESILSRRLKQPNSAAAVQIRSLKTESPLDRASVERAWQAAVQANPILRAGVVWEGMDKPVQVIHRQVESGLETIDSDDWATQPFNAISPPLARLGIREDSLVLAYDPLILDSIGARAVVEQIVRGEQAETRPIWDYLQWTQSQSLTEAEGYWRFALAGVSGPTAILPGARTGQTGIGSACHQVSSAVTSSPAILAAVWAITLCRLKGVDEAVFGVAFRGLPDELSSGLLGPFETVLPVRIRVDAAQTASALIGQIAEQISTIRRYQYLPASTVAEWSDAESELSEPESLVGGGSGAALCWNLYDNCLNLKYDRSLLDDATADMLAAKLGMMLETLSANPEAPLEQFSVLSESERSTILVDWNATGADYPSDKTVHKLFEEQAERNPDAIAVVYEGEALTYSQLDRQANQLANRLIDLGVSHECPVGLHLERGTGMIVGILGAMKAGGAYVPLDPKLPADRLEYMLIDSGARALVTQESLVGSLQAACPTVTLEALLRDPDSISANPKSKIQNPKPTTPPSPPNIESLREPSGQATSLAYVIYTSGSTGQPKGVAVEHRNLVNYVWGVKKRLGLGEGATYATVSTFAADLGNTTVFPSLLTGGTLHIISNERSTDADKMAEYFTANPIDCLKIVPSHLSALLSGSNPAAVIPRKCLVLGGEASSWDLIDRVQALAPDCRILNHYGPTETTVGILTYPVKPTDRPAATVPLGRPLANGKVFILNEKQQPVPGGIAGELCIGGEGVARGYLNHPELTAERFVYLPEAFLDSRVRGNDERDDLPETPITHRPNDPMTQRPNDPTTRLYRTGDLARLLPDGNVEFFGRIDQQIKIRGYRIEPAEIEKRLLEHPSVREALVVAREDSPGEKRLAAYVVGSDSAIDLKAHLSERLPDYMVPTAIVFLDAMPLTPNGKLDRRALPNPDDIGAPGDTFAEPRNQLEEGLCGIFKEVLGVERVGIKDNFFELGGHSLKAIQVVARARKNLKVELPLQALFSAPTVEQLHDLIESKRPKQESSPPSGVPDLNSHGVQPVDSRTITKAPRDKPLPVSFAQHRLWFIDQLEPGSYLYNVPSIYRISGHLNTAALQRTLDEIVRRHEVLRTTFVDDNGVPAQVIGGPRTVELPVYAVTSQVEAERLAAEEARAPFDLSKGPMLRARLIKTGDSEHTLVINVHHVATDGWSKGLLLRELSAIYAAFAEGKPSPLPDLLVQYGDYAAWEREWEQTPEFQSHIEYWKNALAGAPDVLPLPLDRPRPDVASPTGDWEIFNIPASTAARVRALSQAEGATLFMTMLAAYQTLLHRYTGNTDLVIGTDVANRNHREVEDLIGFFLNHVILRTDFSGDPTFRQVLGRVKERSLDAFAHQDVSFDKLVEVMNPARRLSHTPLFQVLFVLQNAPVAQLALPGATLTPVRVDHKTSKYDLSLFIHDRVGDLPSAFLYRTDLFDPATVAKMRENFLRLLDQVSANPDRPVSAIELDVQSKSASPLDKLRTISRRAV